MAECVPVRVDLGQSHSILVEAEAPAGYQKVSIPSVNLDSVLEQIQQFASKLRPALQQFSSAKASVEFGVSFSIEAGQLVALISKGSATASLKVTLQWADGGER